MASNSNDMLAPDPVQIPIGMPEDTSNIYMAACGGRDQVVTQVARHGWLAYETPLPKLLSILVRSGESTFIDIGANTGYYSLLAAATGAAEVRAFEPIPQICDVIKCNIFHTYRSDPHPISIFNVALSNANGISKIYVPDPSHGLIETSSSLNSTFKTLHAYALEVPTLKLDSHIQKYPLNQGALVIIKIDVESHEQQVLEGAELLIRNRMPIVIAEILPGSNVSWFQQWALENKYSHYLLDPQKGALKCQAISASSSMRDHLFMPEALEKSVSLDNLI